MPGSCFACTRELWMTVEVHDTYLAFEQTVLHTSRIWMTWSEWQHACTEHVLHSTTTICVTGQTIANWQIETSAEQVPQSQCSSLCITCCGPFFCCDCFKTDGLQLHPQLLLQCIWQLPLTSKATSCFVRVIFELESRQDIKSWRRLAVCQQLSWQSIICTQEDWIS